MTTHKIVFELTPQQIAQAVADYARKNLDIPGFKKCDRIDLEYTGSGCIRAEAYKSK